MFQTHAYEQQSNVSEIILNFDYKQISSTGEHTKPPTKLQFNTLCHGTACCDFMLERVSLLWLEYTRLEYTQEHYVLCQLQLSLAAARSSFNYGSEPTQAKTQLGLLSPLHCAATLQFNKSLNHLFSFCCTFVQYRWIASKGHAKIQQNIYGKITRDCFEFLIGYVNNMDLIHSKHVLEEITGKYIVIYWLTWENMELI